MTRTRLRPERFVAGGEALARDADGRVVFVRGGIPGDEVTVETIEERGDWSRARIIAVDVPADHRVQPPCPQRRAGCGGCDWQHLAADAQLAAKADIVRDAMRRTARLPDADLSIGRSVPTTGYRTTLRVVGADDGRPAFRRERSHDTVPASGCLIAHPALHPILDAARLTPGLEMTLRASAATGEVTARWDVRDGDVVGLPAGARTGPNAQLVERVAGHDLRVSAGSFFQSGPAAADLLVDAVGRAVPELSTATSVLDAYAGVGLFAVASVPPTAQVIAVETSKTAVHDCRANLAGRDARVERKEFGTWRPEPGLGLDVAIADPSRSGLGRPGVSALTAAQPGVVALVSCDPVALARDTSLLASAGYRHVSTEVLDLFPHTHHVECVTRFERSGGGR